MNVLFLSHDTISLRQNKTLLDFIKKLEDKEACFAHLGLSYADEELSKISQSALDLSLACADDVSYTDSLKEKTRIWVTNYAEVADLCVVYLKIRWRTANEMKLAASKIPTIYFRNA